MEALEKLLYEALNQLAFHMREEWGGGLFLRQTLPQVEIDSEEIAYYSEILQEAVKIESKFEITPEVTIDVGCRNWSYVSAYHTLFPHTKLLGVEVDGNRRFWNLFRRQDYAKSYLKALKHSETVNVLFQDFSKLTREQIVSSLLLDSHSTDGGIGTRDGLLFCFLFPFVSVRPCLKWGLPSHYSHYDKLISHAKELAREFNTPLKILSLHQGDWEAQIAFKIYTDLKIGPLRQTRIKSVPGSRYKPYDQYLITYCD